MRPSARHSTADTTLPALRTLRHRAMDGDRQAARLLIRQGAPLIPELLDTLLQAPTGLEPQQRQRLLILMGRLAAHWPDELLAVLAERCWRAAPAKRRAMASPASSRTGSAVTT